MMRHVRAALAALCCSLIAWLGAAPAMATPVNGFPVVTPTTPMYLCGYSNVTPFGFQCYTIASVVGLTSATTNFPSTVTFPAPSSGPAKGSIILTPGASPVGTPANGSLWCTGTGCFAVVAGSIISLGTTVPSTGAGGTTGQVQFNSSGILAGIPGFTWSGSVLTLPSGTVFPAGSLVNPSITGTLFSAVGATPLIDSPACDAGATWLIGTADTLYCTQATGAASDNIGVGTITLGKITTGCCNIAIGSETMRFATTASDDDCVGFEACHVMTTGSQNVGIGFDALSAELAGTQNVAVGQAALSLQNGGTGNIGIGEGAGASMSTGDDNLCVGNGACPTITTGMHNISIGFQAGYGPASGHGNVGIGGQSTTLAEQNDSITINDGDGGQMEQYLAANGYVQHYHPDDLTSFYGGGSLSGGGIVAGTTTVLGTTGTAACATNHLCDSVSGEMTITTGTGSPAAGVAATVNFPLTRAKAPNCVVSMGKTGTGGVAAVPIFPTETVSSLVINVEAGLTASATYTADYLCGGI